MVQGYQGYPDGLSGRDYCYMEGCIGKGYCPRCGETDYSVLGYFGAVARWAKAWGVTEEEAERRMAARQEEHWRKRDQKRDRKRWAGIEENDLAVVPGTRCSWCGEPMRRVPWDEGDGLTHIICMCRGRPGDEDGPGEAQP